MSINKNVGRIDRVIRIVLGIVLLFVVSLVFPGPKTRWAYLGLIGFIPLITGIFGYSPFYQLLGINTHKKPEGNDMGDRELMVNGKVIIDCLNTINTCLKWVTGVLDLMIEQLERGCGNYKHVMDLRMHIPPNIREQMEQVDNIELVDPPKESR